MDSSSDVESQPLLAQGSSAPQYDSGADNLDTFRLQRERSAFLERSLGEWEGKGRVLDTMTYETRDLIGWRAFTILKRTQWVKWSTWYVTFKLMCLSVLVGIMMVTVLPDPAQLKTSKFNQIGVFLNVFVGLLLGFFMSSSMNRWYNCTNGFMELFDAIRNMQMQFIALGVPFERIFLCIRYGLISAYLLSKGLHVEALPAHMREEAAKELWEDLTSDYETDEQIVQDGSSRSSIRYSHHKRYVQITRDESAILQGQCDPAGVLWIWIASLIGRMAEDGQIPGMSTPTYGRIMNIAQDAHAGIRTVRGNIAVQAPFIYIHMLSTLVQVNNIINAVCFGLTCGALTGTYLERRRSGPVHYDQRSSQEDVLHDIENVIVCFFFSVVGPFLYQAILEVSICIAQPFADTDGEIPTHRLLKDLEQDLRDGFGMAKKCPGWEAPAFQRHTKTSKPKDAVRA